MSTEVRNDMQSSQEAYRQKLEETREEQESELARQKEKNAKAAAEERTSGEAAVNHIREETRQKLESLKNQGENRVNNERTTYDRRLKETQKQKEEEIGSQRQNIGNAQEESCRKIDQAHERTQEETSREQNATREFARHEDARRGEMIRQDHDDIEKSRVNVVNEKNKLDTGYHKQIQKMNNEHMRSVEALKQEHQEAVNRQAMQDDVQLHSEQDRTGKQLEQLRKEYSQREQEARTRGQTILHDESENSQHRMTELQSKDRQAFDNERVRGSQSVEKTRAYYAGSEARLHREGDDQLNSQREMNEQQLRAQDQDYHAQREDRGQKFEAEKKKAFDIYRNQMQHDDVFYRKSLAQQKAEFDRIYVQNAESNENILADSKEKLNVELIRQKQKAMQSLGKYNDKADDPFYQIKTVDYHLNEDQHMYELHAKIPEREKDNVRVIVKDNKVVLQGQRRFEDKVADEHHHLATESFQSFREEIPLSHPVLDHYISSNWKDGVLTLKIPKA